MGVIKNEGIKRKERKRGIIMPRLLPYLLFILNNSTIAIVYR